MRTTPRKPRCERASKAVNEGDAAFVAAYDKWTLSVDNATEDKGFAAATLRTHIGNQSQSAFLKEPPTEKVARMRGVFNKVKEVPALTGDPQKLDALRVATEALRSALKAHEVALPARKGTVSALKVAAREFDSAYGHLVKEVRAYGSDELVREIPRFERVRRVPGAASEDSVTPEPDEDPTS